MPRHRIAGIFARLLLLATAFTAIAAPGAQAREAHGLTHVHGLAYSADGKRLKVPSHHGLAIYAEGRWSVAPGPQHDYMGFTATRNRLYSSGHPAPNSGLVDPFGLIRSQDGGRIWDRLGLEGESDFHDLAASWNTNAIYVWNPKPNSRMPQPGLHYTLNEGFQWQHAAGAGLSGEVNAIAVHPDDAKIVAVSTATGIFVSRDSAASFRPVVERERGLAVYFDLDGKHLWYSSFARGPRLTRLDLGSEQRAGVELPALEKDAVAYIAQNPAQRTEYAIATFQRSVYVSRDGGRSWMQIANRGKTQ